MDNLSTAAGNARQACEAGRCPDNANPSPRVGAGEPPIVIYLHFPYCLSKCPYCDFVSVPVAPGDIGHAAYADALVAELEQRAGCLAGRRVEAIFVGGGTPSLWRPDALGRVLARLRAGPFEVADACEVTLECNPGSLDEARAAAFVSVGINRLTVGVQALDAARLRHLGRIHDVAEAFDAVRSALNSGAQRVGVDLLFGVAMDRPGGGGPARQQTAAQAATEAVRLVRMGVGHLSAYALTIEPDTPFGVARKAGRLPVAREGTVAESFVAIEQRLAAEGLEHYEISSYARPGQQCRHNLAYWRGHDYLGLGCAAVSTLSAGSWADRITNPTVPGDYFAAIDTNRLAETQQIERLDPATRLRERIMLGLRTAEGCDLHAAAEQLGVDPWTAARRATLTELLERGQIEQSGDRVRIAPAAWLFADGIAAALM